jgi:hypothetical protein
MRGTASKGVAAGLVAAVLLAGCGQSGSTKAMNDKFQTVDYKMSTLEVGVVPSRELLANLTRKYISLIHEYADALGAAEVRRRLVEKETELESYCLPCSGLVTDELAKQ